ncbi:3D-(3,5/4)-trihydroxycyclohexane-1,2-dione acylhydrolase (decyclizing) [Skermania sp. ID1734]|uniref:3D-(3,5/4)-trihydroxycyclohexane-1,2-dione acylhydrolase (decyclizing) n=1 Tax=Skermania sp. ID1734 TaxID=2597516 RepID=UPI001180AC90|nr:3D-(3,5/4)-trihydroxycyclohexane-1,2-dione acylhydrolase (decyclizing) [Skermania sp. ID1734]TSE00979.1 3D-(3,5/4)-trihydroxycyclohexane-1,2-dione acylhydrolase (decyclizing) [Skermania sp. ID1734]
MSTIRLTVAQATIRFLANQYSERDGQRQRLVVGCFGIFGHGNLAGLGTALLESELDDPRRLPYVLGRNEQALVHAAAAYARARNRLQTWAVTSSIGPGATNMVTGAALATINRLPVLLLPGDVFATRSAPPVLQELECFGAGDISVNDALRPVSKYFDRVWRPDQLPAALLSAMRVLTDPVETGAVTIALPQDVQAEAFDWPDDLFAERVWRVPRSAPEGADIAEAAAAIRAARRPLIVAGGGVLYSEASHALTEFAAATGIPVAVTQSGKSAIPSRQPECAGAIGVTGTAAANALARDADVVIGVGTRYTDFTTASHSAFGCAQVRFVNINVARFDAVKLGGIDVVADARAAIDALTKELGGYRVEDAYHRTVAERVADWDHAVAEATAVDGCEPPTQAAVIGMVNAAAGEDDVVVCAAGSMPGDLHKLWRVTKPGTYHVEYGYSCMGYEVAGGLGVGLARPGGDVFVLVGDGSWLMMSSELVTAIQEGVKLIVVLVDNGGFASIGGLSESVGAQRFGTAYRFRSPSGRLDGPPLPVDLAANAASLGAHTISATSCAEFADALREAKASEHTTVIHVRTDPHTVAPASESWWDVPVSAVPGVADTARARTEYDSHKRAQRDYLRPTRDSLREDS